MKKRQIFFNANMSVLQIIICGAVLFILYRYLIKSIGIEQIGIWSLVFATTTLTQMANLGFAGSVVKFVAKYIACGKDDEIADVVQTASITVSIVVGIILLAGYPIIKLALCFIVTNNHLPLAISLLPYAIVSSWMTSNISIVQGSLEGYQRIDLRSYLQMGDAISHLLMCVFLVPTYGLMGLAYARIIVNVGIFLAGWRLLKKYLPALPPLPFRWNKGLFKEMFSYGMNFQLISFISMSYDPLTKALLSKFGGLSAVGYFEMANKLVLQFRSIIVSANQVIVPVIANLQEINPDKIYSIYLSSYQLVYYFSISMYSMVIISSTIITRLWIGNHDPMLDFFIILLAAGSFLNTINVPAYFINLGTGEMLWNVLGHIAIGLLNLGLGLLFGSLYGGLGVVLAWVVSLALGSTIITLSYHIQNRFPLMDMLPSSSGIISSVCLLSIFLNYLIQTKITHSLDTIIINMIITFSFLLIMFISIWQHPVRRNLTDWFVRESFSLPRP